MGQFEKLLKDYDLHCKRIEKATTVKVNESFKEKEARIKKLEADYSKWFEYYFPNYAKSRCAWFHIKAAKLILKYKVLYLILEWFRGAAKSVHVCMGIPMFLMVRGELKFMLLIGENADKARKLLSDIQAQLKYNNRFINDYGQQFQYGDWAEGNFTTKEGIHFHALGLGQSPRGVREGENRPDYIVCDDLDTKERCKNPKRVNEAVEWIMEDLWGCFDEGIERFVLANNRIHKNGILANLVKEFRKANSKAKEEGFPETHHHIKVNAVDSEGEPTWPEKYTKEYWAKKKASRTNRSWNREYMNNPIEDGKIFKADWIRHKKMLPLKDYDALALYGDLSYKDSGDFKAMKLWGKTKRELHHIFCFVRQTSKRNCARWLYDLYERHKLWKYNIKYKIEGLFAQDEFINEFDKEGDDRGYYIPIVADKRPKEGKYDRVEGISGYWERGNVYYNVDEQGSTDQEEAIDQTLAFEKGSGAPDDAPDADHGAIADLERSSYVESFEPRQGKRKKEEAF